MAQAQAVAMDKPIPSPLDELISELDKHMPTEFTAGSTGGPVLLHVVGLEQIERWKRTIRQSRDALAAAQQEKEAVERKWNAQATADALRIYKAEVENARLRDVIKAVERPGEV